MTRSQAFGVIVGAVLLGVVVGGIGGYRYARESAGRDLLDAMHQDAASTLKSYERIKDLAQRDEDEKMMKYLEGVIHIQRTVLKATELPPDTAEVSGQ